ncbi:hypothetical protein K491DRAFT_696890 [Lophiostoma macrostomum CBS 122681]|uniref:Cora-domain-containing protein n=1 Tax=Lophiostoma macrostomum CBS 122681 TaxID=1314788 RepID=A0A6A6ST41_9PLEO|nr:hypothetical protein K491DRAFT_696890 [Lophiostoma macrostomum CBS 122681]
MDSQILFRSQQEESLQSINYILPTSRQPSSVEVLEVRFQDGGKPTCQTVDLVEDGLPGWLSTTTHESPAGLHNRTQGLNNRSQRNSIFFLGPSLGHFRYESEKFPGFDSYPSDGLPISPELYEKLAKSFHLPAATAWSLTSDCAHFQKYNMDSNSSDEKRLGFTMRLCSRGIVEIDVCASISYRPSAGTVRCFLQGCNSEQQRRVRDSLRQWAALTDHPLLLPTILVEMKVDRINDEEIALWNLLVRVEGQSKQTGAPAVNGPAPYSEHLKNTDELEEEQLQQGRVDSEFQEVTLGVVGVIQRTTSLGSHAKALLLTIEGIQKSIRFVSNVPSTLEADHIKKVGEMLSEKLELLEHRTKVMIGDIEFIEKRAQAQQSAVYNFLAQRDARLQRDLAGISGQISQAAKRDSSAMKGIAILTMVFLPGTYIATFFTMPILDFTAHSRVPSADRAFWLYWSITVPLTVMVLIAYLSYVFYVNRKYKTRYRSE